jgi:hypothetical protein
MKRGGSVLAGTAGEKVGNLIVDGKKPLHLGVGALDQAKGGRMMSPLWF